MLGVPRTERKPREGERKPREGGLGSWSSDPLVEDHDPERYAAEYLCGEIPRRFCRWFEAHLLECDDCWHEVWLGREGRRMAEAAREMAPSALRDAVRVAVMFSDA
jgi:hypothetical protein